MASGLVRASVRHASRHPWQLGLAVLGVALGVAVVVAIDLSIESARRAFTLSNEAVVGRATHRIVGASAGFPEELFVRLRRARPGLAAAPVVEGHALAGGDPGRGMTILGVDPLSERAFRSHLGAGSGGPWAVLMTTPRALALARASADALGVGKDDVLALRVAGRAVETRVAGVLDPEDRLAREGLADVVLTDIASAQEMLDRVGLLDRIDLRLPAGADAGRIEAILPEGVELLEVGPRSRSAAQMTDAFELNLRMLSLLALVVGAFLIYNTMSFSVVQRRVLIGNLRAIGVTRNEVLGLVLAEAAAVGAMGTLAGLAGGIALASGLVDLVAATINDLYYRVRVSEVGVSPASLAKGALLGVGASVIAALAPAREATRVPPRVALSRSRVESAARRLAPRAALAGAVVAGAGAALLAVPGGVGLGFVSLFALVAGFALAAPAATVVLAGAAHRVSAGLVGVLGPMATRGIVAGLSRTGVAVAALMVAVAATVGVGVMVDSFRQTVASWLEVTLRADVYVGVPGSGARAPLQRALVERVRALPEVGHTSAGRSVRVEGPGGPVDLVVLRMAPESYDGFLIVRGDPAAAWAAFDESGAVLVSEPFAYRHRLDPGDRISLLTDDGRRAFEAAAVFRDYGSDRGVVLMSRATYDRHWRDRGVTSLGVYAAPGVGPPRLRAAVAEAVRSERVVLVRDNAAIKEASLAIFDRTFAITEVMRLLAMAIAFVGILSALMAIELERAKEIAVLRATGLTPAQVWGVVQIQTGVLGAIAGVLSLPLGLALALVLIHVINRRSFGWGMETHVDPALLGEALLLAIGAALLAGAYPAWRMARTPPALALREE